MAIPIFRANPTDDESLSLLTMRSKAHWGYTQEQLANWKEDLTISKDYIRKNEVFALKEQGVIIGYYSCFALSPHQLKLDNLFVDPNHMGMGFGDQLMQHFLIGARKMGFEKVVLDADPHAERFYAKYQFKTTGQLPSSVPGRSLPIMELDLV